MEQRAANFHIPRQLRIITRTRIFISTHPSIALHTWCARSGCKRPAAQGRDLPHRWRRFATQLAGRRRPTARAGSARDCPAASAKSGWEWNPTFAAHHWSYAAVDPILSRTLSAMDTCLWCRTVQIVCHLADRQGVGFRSMGTSGTCMGRGCLLTSRRQLDTLLLF